MSLLTERDKCFINVLLRGKTNNIFDHNSIRCLDIIDLYNCAKSQQAVDLFMSRN